VKDLRALQLVLNRRLLTFLHCRCAPLPGSGGDTGPQDYD
jgi:hypothetical protein